MPLVIEVKGRKPITWDMNGEEAFPSLDILKIEMLEADGKECDIIVKNYTGIPLTRHTLSQVWLGVFAQQVFANLQNVLATHEAGGRRKTATGPMDG